MKCAAHAARHSGVLGSFGRHPAAKICGSECHGRFLTTFDDSIIGNIGLGGVNPPRRKFEKFDRMMRGLEMIDPKSKSRLITSTKGEQPTKSNDSAAEGECRKEVIMDLVFRVLRGDLVEGPRGKSLVVSPKGSRSVGY